MNDFWRMVLVQIFFTFITCSVIKFYVERHSVHPVYGNKVELTSGSCQPWDDCR